MAHLFIAWSTECSFVSSTKQEGRGGLTHITQCPHQYTSILRPRALENANPGEFNACLPLDFGRIQHTASEGFLGDNQDFVCSASLPPPRLSLQMLLRTLLEIVLSKSFQQPRCVFMYTFPLHPATLLSSLGRRKQDPVLLFSHRGLNVSS